MDNEDAAIELLERNRDELEKRLARINAAIRALRNGTDLHSQGVELKMGAGKSVSVIVHIINYLKLQDKPVHQNDIIRDVGDLRRRLYPAQKGHYANIWRALEYHVRHDKLINCVQVTGEVTALRPLPERPKGLRTLPDYPDLYLADNYFVLKEELLKEGAGEAWAEG